jgi:Plavaka transposase
MRVICPGCGEPFKRSGLAHHLRQSNDPQCRLPDIRQQSDDDLGEQDTLDDVPPTPVFGPAVVDVHENEPQEQFRLGIDPAGDVFGDYANYTAVDLGLDDGEDEDLGEEDPENLAETEEEEDDALLAEEEQQLEPERQSPRPGITDQELERDDQPSHRPLRLRGGFEGPLSNRPEIVEFSDGNAGARFKTNLNPGNQDYRQSVSNADNPNPYEPFSSKLDWELAYWAKRQGQGSNALTELLSIEGVSFLRLCKTQRGLTDFTDKVVERLGLGYKNTAELNKLIDLELPGRPSFQRHEVIVGTEVCDVYFRDVIACVRALFADPDLTQYLVTAPEKHLTDGSNGRKIRMYHDMHTGKWWWSTQVSINACRPRC